MHTVDATLHTSGPRPQNIPIDVKTVDLPKPDRGHANIDYAAIERRVMQHVAALVTRRESRNGRRRSRQCRGSRVRNYTRANARAKLGASATGEASVFVDAVKSGAYAAASRKAVS